MKIDSLLVSICASTLFDKEIDIPQFSSLSEKEWHSLFELSCPHGTAAVVYDFLSTLPRDNQLPKMLSIIWAIECEKVENSYQNKSKIILKLNDLFSSNGYQFVLLKGASTAAFYPIPSHRYFGDIDFYLLKDGKIASLEGDAFLSKAINVKTDASHHHHNVYNYDGVLLENHYDFINIHAHRSSRKVEESLKFLALEPLSSFNLTGTSINKAPATFNAIFMLYHLASHFAAAEIGLRHLLDYGLFLKNERENIDFKIVLSVFDKCHLSLFASAINSILVNQLGLPLECTSGITSSKELEEKILNEVLSPSFPIYNAKCHKNIVSSILFRYKRFKANRWKHDLIYPENYYETLFRSSLAHLLKPKSLLH